MTQTVSRVEEYFKKRFPAPCMDKNHERNEVLVVDNYVTLGQLTALRFLEWVCQNPGGVAALPTGKTPEFFIKWVQHYLENWNREMKEGILARIGLGPKCRPEMRSIHFVQLDEFFPIHPEHERSFHYFVRKYYLGTFGFDIRKALLIDTYHLHKIRGNVLDNIRSVEDVFPDGVIDLGLRIKHPATDLEDLQKKTIRQFDQFCDEYESAIRKLGGIGFFLGGIGPDGHIAFNVKGSSHFSHTRLTKMNYESQAAAAGDLGGIENVRKRAVITIGLETITYNPNVVAIIIAAGESKAKIIAESIESEPSPNYPATCLQKLQQARFYLTRGSASKLKERKIRTCIQAWRKSDRVLEEWMIDGALIRSITLDEKISGLAGVPEWKLATRLSGQSTPQLIDWTRARLIQKIKRGLNIPEGQRILHTGPHHDDIELAYFPLLHHLVRSKHNENFFCYCTSGFTSVTNTYVRKNLEHLSNISHSGRFEREIPKSRRTDWIYASDDITGYLNGIANQNLETQAFYIACRLARKLYNYLRTDDDRKLFKLVQKQIVDLDHLAPGRIDPPVIQEIKGWLREFEAELVWAHFGIGMDHVTHLRLQFYSSDIFPEYPDVNRDVVPILRLMETIRPTIISLALDPEGSGPDTHFKTLIALSLAIDQYVKQTGQTDLRIWGYRNVWSRFHPSQVNTIVPISLNSFGVLHNMFNSCFVSQKSASFPSWEMEGTFSQLAQKVWVEQYNDLVRLLGKNFFYQDPNPMMRRSYGAIYLKDMTYNQFVVEMDSIKALIESKKGLKNI